MKIFVGIDDSRRLDGGGAGEIVSLLTRTIDEKGWGKSAIPSRHRLYPHPDTGYRKHNTARSFSAEVEEQYMEELIDYACVMIKSNGTSDSNSGLAIAVPERYFIRLIAGDKVLAEEEISIIYETSFTRKSWIKTVMY